MSQHSDHPEEDSDFQDLEESLARLKPTAPSDAFSRHMNRQIEVMDSERAEKSIAWVRFAPVAAAACVVLTSAFLYKEHLIQKRETETDTPSVDTGDPIRKPAPVVNNDTVVSGSYLPVSQGHFFRGAESGGIIGTGDDGIPLREYRLEFDDTLHWYNPETETNLRLFIPRDEFIRVPVPID